MSLALLKNPSIRNLYGLAERKDVVELQTKVVELETHQKELMEVVNTLKQEIEQLKNAKPAGSALK